MTGYREKIINPLKTDEWDDIAVSIGGYSFFHSRCWAQVLADAYGYKPYYYTLFHNGSPTAAWPVCEVGLPWNRSKGVALPFSDHCDPLLSNASVFDELYRGIIRFSRKMNWRGIEFRGGTGFLSDQPKSSQYNLHFLPLHCDEKEMKKNLRNSTWRNIKRAVSQNVTVTMNTSHESLKMFYRLNCATRKYHGLPPQPQSFFRSIYQNVLVKKKGIVVLAAIQNKVIAGAVFMHFGNAAVYKYGASLRDNLEVRPNNLVMWEAIKWYGNQGFQFLDLGRTELDNGGLNQFKRGWGAIRKKIGYFNFDLERFAFSSQKRPIPQSIKQVFRKLPVPVLRVLGTLTYRYMG